MKKIVFTVLALVCMALCISLPQAAMAGSQSPVLVLDPGGHKAIIRDIAFTPDQRHLLSAGDDKAVRVWDIETGKIVRFIRGEIGAGSEGKIFAMVLSPDGRVVAVGGWLANRTEERDALRLHDAATGRIMGLLKGHTSVILSLAFSLDGKYLASGQGGTSNPTVRIWDMDKKKQVHVLKGHKNEIYALAFSPDGKRLISGSDDHTLILWDTISGKQIATLTGHKDRVRYMSYDPKGRYIASGSWDNTIRLWDGMTGRFIKILADQGTDIGSLTFSPDGTKLLSGVGSNNCHVYSIPGGRELVTFREHDNSVFATAISPDGRLAATGGGNNQDILIWNLANGRVKKRLSGVGAPVWAVGFSKDSSTIAWGQNTISGWKVNDYGSLKHILLLRTGEKWNLVPSRRVKNESGFARAANTHGTYRLKHEKGGGYGYDAVLKLLKNGKEAGSVERYSISGYCHRSYTFTPDGRFVVSGGDNGILTLYSIPNLNKTADFIGHESDVWAVACSPDGRFLVSGSGDQTVRLWDLRAAANGGDISPLFTLFPTKDGKEWLAYTPEGYFTGSENAARFVGYQINKGPDKTPDFIKNEQIEQVFFRPDLVAAKAQGRSIADLPDISAILAKGSAPKLRILSPRDGATIPGDTVTLRYAVQDQGSGVGKVRIFLNSTAVDTTRKRGIGRKKRRRREEVREVQIGLEPGNDNHISIVAYNANGELKSKEASVRVFSQARIRKPRFIALVAGINRFANPDIKLRYAKSDAEAIADVLRKQVSPALFSKTEITLLTDNDAKVGKLRNAMDRIKNTVRAEDVVVIYIASHGEIREGRYYLLTADTDYLMTEDLKKTCLTGEEIQERLGEIPASKKLLMLDTCNSGSVALAMNTRSISENAVLVRLSRAVGTYIIAASTEAQYASEGYRGHGLFSWVLIEGLKGGADLDRNGIVEVDELKLYVKDEVPKLAQRHFGRRQFPITNGRGDSFPLVKK